MENLSLLKIHDGNIIYSSIGETFRSFAINNKSMRMLIHILFQYANLSASPKRRKYGN